MCIGACARTCAQSQFSGASGEECACVRAYARMHALTCAQTQDTGAPTHTRARARTHTQRHIRFWRLQRERQHEPDALVVAQLDLGKTRTKITRNNLAIAIENRSMDTFFPRYGVQAWNTSSNRYQRVLRNSKAF